MSKYFFIFALTIFVILSISGPGIFLNDEWSEAQTLRQLSQGHQITYNEGKYGYYANGTISDYVNARHNMLMYPVILPLISLPIHLIFTFSDCAREIILLVWITCGITIITSLYNIYGKNKKLYSIIGCFLLLVFLNLIFFEKYDFQSQYAPYEVISIVFTNILLYGIFSVVVFKISEILHPDSNYKQIFTWLLVMSCTSLMFWSGTCKDHMLTSLMCLLILYLQLINIKCENTNVNRLSYVLIGLLIWTRPEIGIFVGCGLLLYNTVKYKTLYELSMGIWIFIGTIPMFINNYIVTGNALSNPFLNANSMWYSSDIVTQSTSFAFDMSISSIVSIVKLLVIPSSGSGSVILFTGVVIICLYHNFSKPLIHNDKFTLLASMSILPIIYYILFSIQTLQSDTGVIPDIRYLTSVYAPLMFMASLLIDNKNTKENIKLIIVTSSILIIISTLGCITGISSTYTIFSTLINIFIIAIFIFTLKDNDHTGKLLLISLPLTWQVIMTFIYYNTKICLYPMFLPLTSYIYGLVFT